MSCAALCAVALLAIAEEPRTTNADAASEGERDLSKVSPMFKKFVSGQPYGKKWLELAKTEPAPKDRTGLGEAKTHDKLKHDPMELQAQAQYVEATDTGTRYGVVVVRGERVFRDGKLEAVRIVLEPAGKPPREKFVEDIEALAASWPAALELDPAFSVTKNDLIDQKKKKPAAFPSPPLFIELTPRSPSK